MLFNNLYKIVVLTETENKIQASIVLHADHAIFKGHFPGQPVLPGVCMLEMITEITGSHLKKSFHISEAALIKFLNMIDPRKNPEITLEIIYQEVPGAFQVHGKIFHDSLVFMKYQLVLLPDKSN